MSDIFDTLGGSTVSGGSFCFGIQKLALPVYSFYAKFFAPSHHYFIFYSLISLYFHDRLGVFYACLFVDAYSDEPGMGLYALWLV